MFGSTACCTTVLSFFALLDLHKVAAFVVLMPQAAVGVQQDQQKDGEDEPKSAGESRSYWYLIRNLPTEFEKVWKQARRLQEAQQQVARRVNEVKAGLEEAHQVLQKNAQALGRLREDLSGTRRLAEANGRVLAQQRERLDSLQNDIQKVDERLTEAEQAVSRQRDRLDSIENDVSDMDKELSATQEAVHRNAQALKRVEGGLKATRELAEANLNATAQQGAQIAALTSRIQQLERQAARAMWWLKFMAYVVGFFALLSLGWFLLRCLAWAYLAICSRHETGDEVANPQEVTDHEVLVQPGEALLLAPGATAGYSGPAPVLRRVGNLFQAIKRRYVFMDVFEPADGKRCHVWLAMASHGKLERLDVPEGAVARIKPWCFLGAKLPASSKDRVRLRTFFKPWLEFFLHGTRRWFVVPGPATVLTWVHTDARQLHLRATNEENDGAQSLRVIPRLIAGIVAHEKNIEEQLRWRGWKYALIRRTPVSKVIRAHNGEVTVVVSPEIHATTTEIIKVKQGSRITDVLLSFIDALPVK